MDREESPTVADLLNRARDGDDGARDLLMRRCRSYVGVVARAQVESWLQAKVDASDLVQQTLLEAHRGLDGFRGTTEAEWLGWLKRILTHNATDFVRRFKGTEKRAIGREVPLQRPSPGRSREMTFDPRDPAESPSALAVKREREFELADAVSQLPDDYREVVMLRNLQRLSFSEVAERMGRTRPAVQMLWLRALRKLEESLSEPGEAVSSREG